MRSLKPTHVMLASLLALGACSQTPPGPTVAVMPAEGKSFAVFQTEQAQCKDFAGQQVAGGADRDTAMQLGAAALTTLLGTGLGGAIGGLHGAGIGAGAGALGGTGIAAYKGSNDNTSLQKRYDLAYAQCMYAQGNQVPTLNQPPMNGARTSSLYR